MRNDATRKNDSQPLRREDRQTRNAAKRSRRLDSFLLGCVRDRHLNNSSRHVSTTFWAYSVRWNGSAATWTCRQLLWLLVMMRSALVTSRIRMTPLWYCHDSKTSNLSFQTPTNRPSVRRFVPLHFQLFARLLCPTTGNGKSRRLRPKAKLVKRKSTVIPSNQDAAGLSLWRIAQVNKPRTSCLALLGDSDWASCIGILAIHRLKQTVVFHS